MTDDPTEKPKPDTFKQHYAGTNIAKRQLQEHDSINNQGHANNPNREPTPMEVVTRWWGFIRDPLNAQGIIAAFTIVIALSGLGYGVFSVLQWVAMRDAISASRDSQRAWVGITDPMVDSVTYEGRDILVRGHHKLKNFGLSPAFKVYPMIMLAPDFVEMDAAAKDSCSSAKEWFDFKSESIKKTTQGREQGITLFPGQEIPGLPFQTQATAIRPPSGALWLVGCMYYRDQLGNTRYTQFCLVTSEQARKESGPFQRCSMYERAE